MNREIKFKVWDKESKVFVDISGHKQAVRLTDEGFDMSTGYDGLDNPTFGMDDQDGYPKMTYQEFKDFQNRFVYLQFTGIKDSKGKEIYGGDVIDGLVVTYCGDQESGLGMNCGWYLQRNDFEAYIELESKHNDNGDNYIVQGNIFENPELLEAVA
jgi:hypothetical protein